MDVDVDKLGVDSNVEHGDRVPSALEPPLVALLERVHQGAGADRPSIDGEDHAVAAAPAEPRLTHHPGHEGYSDELEHLRGHRRPVNSTDRPPPVAIAGGADRGPAVDREVEANVRMQEREAGHHVLDRG